MKRQWKPLEEETEVSIVTGEADSMCSDGIAEKQFQDCAGL